MPNVYTQVAHAKNTGGTENFSDIWWCPSVVDFASSVPFSVYFHLSAQAGPTIAPLGFIYEVSGLTGVDTTGAANSTSGVTALTATQGAADTGTNNFVVGVLATGGVVGSLNQPLTVLDANAAGYSQISHQINVSAGGTNSAAWTWTTAAQAAGVIASFKSNACTLVQTMALFYTFYTISLVNPNGLVISFQTPPTPGNSVIFAFALGRNPGSGPNSIVSISDSVPFGTVPYIGG